MSPFVRFLGFFLAIIPCALTAKEVLLVERDSFVCFLENIESYIATEEGGLVMVFFEKCPDTSVTPEDISNMAVALDPSVTVSAADTTQSAVTFSNAEVGCMARNRDSILADLQVGESSVNLRAIFTRFCQ